MYLCVRDGIVGTCVSSGAYVSTHTFLSRRRSSFDKKSPAYLRAQLGCGGKKSGMFELRQPPSIRIPMGTGEFPDLVFPVWVRRGVLAPHYYPADVQAQSSITNYHPTSLPSPTASKKKSPSA